MSKPDQDRVARGFSPPPSGPDRTAPLALSLGPTACQQPAGDATAQCAAQLRGLRSAYLADLDGMVKGPDSPDSLALAAGYWLWLPVWWEMLECLGPALGGEDEHAEDRAHARLALLGAHEAAVQVLLKAADRQGLDGAALYVAGRLCRDLISLRPGSWRRLLGRGRAHDAWPACLGRTRARLTEREQDIIDRGQATLELLSAWLDLDGAPEAPSAVEAQASATLSARQAEHTEGAAVAPAAVEAADAPPGARNVERESREGEALVALLRLSATPDGPLASRRKIAEKAGGKGTKGTAYRRALENLDEWELATAEARGYRLTAAGEKEARRLAGPDRAHR